MKRRDFLRSSAGLPLMASVGASQSSLQRATTPEPGILKLGSQKQLFLDDWLIEETSRISRFMYRPEKFAENPIIEADRPWEKGLQSGYFTGVQIFGQAVIYDEEEKIFKTWYLPRSLEDGEQPWCYAVSSDGYPLGETEPGNLRVSGFQEEQHPGGL